MRLNYHEYDNDEKEDWNDDVDDVEKRLPVQINSKLDLRIMDVVINAEDSMSTRARANQLPDVYKIQ